MTIAIITHSDEFISFHLRRFKMSFEEITEVHGGWTRPPGDL